MSFIIRTIGRTIVSAAVSAGVAFAVKKAAESRTKRKPATPRLTDDRKPAQRAKSPEA